jgi:hypothetical protein
VQRAVDGVAQGLDENRIGWFADRFETIAANIERVIQGKRPVIEQVLICLVAEGHVLVEDVPGVGKTALAKSLARSIDCTFNRIQFTPDLLPSDVTGVSVWDRQASEFSFKPGAIFANIVVGDEINRASPKTQAALLEAMEERQVTVDGTTRTLPGPFMVVATQNPLEHEGTYPLPEAQLDRFMMRVKVGYPDRAKELEMLDTHALRSTYHDLSPVVHAEDVVAMVDIARQGPRRARHQGVHHRRGGLDPHPRRGAVGSLTPLCAVPAAGRPGPCRRRPARLRDPRRHQGDRPAHPRAPDGAAARGQHARAAGPRSGRLGAEEPGGTRLGRDAAVTRC